MSRMRMVKPEFFHHEVLAELPFQHRLFFIGLWCEADREGRLEDRPKRLKAKIFPHDSIDVEPILEDLERTGFLERYAVDGKKLVFIPGFTRQQKCHVNEQASTLPAPPSTTKAVAKDNLGGAQPQPETMPGTTKASACTPVSLSVSVSESLSESEKHTCGPGGPARARSPARLSVVADSPDATASVMTTAPAPPAASPAANGAGASVSAEVAPRRENAAQAAPAFSLSPQSAQAKRGAAKAVAEKAESEVFEAWRTAWALDASWKLTPKRRKSIADRLADGHTVADLVDAVHGSKLDPWDERPRNKGLELLLRPDNVAKFIEFKRKGVPPATKRAAGFLSAEDNARLQATLTGETRDGL